MQLRLKATNITATPATKSYLEKRLATLQKYWKGDPDTVMLDVELAQTTKHHQQGPIFMCEITVTMPQRQLRAVAHEADLYAAIDTVKDELRRQLVESKDKQETLYRRGSAMMKRLMRRWTGEGGE